MKKRLIFIVPAAIAGLVLLCFVGGEVVKLLWNWLLPPLFGWRELTFWQAFGILALCRILFGGFRAHGHSGSHSPIRHRMADRMADRVAERWDKMSPEERERFRGRLRDRCGCDPMTADEAKS
jgi:hypothetical protein